MPGNSAPADDAGMPELWWPARASADRWTPIAALELPTGEIVVADRAQNRLFLLRSADEAPYRLPAPSLPPVEWTALSLAPGLSFYAMDGPGRRIHQYDFRGNYVGEALDLDRAAAEAGLGAVDPYGLAVDRSGRTVITDRQGDRVLLFGPGWSYLGTAGESGSAPGAWRRPAAAAASDRGSFLVADEGNRRLVLLDGVGSVTAVRDVDSAPRGVTAFDPGRFAVVLGDRVEVLDDALVVRETHMLAPGPGCPGGKAYGSGALCGSRHRLLAGEGCSGRLLEIRFPGD